MTFGRPVVGIHNQTSAAYRSIVRQQLMLVIAAAL